MQAIVAFHKFVAAALVSPILAHQFSAIIALDQGCLSARGTNIIFLTFEHSQLSWIQRFRLLLAV